MIDAPHNLVRIERHGEVDYLVHRKGAAPAAAGAMGLIPGEAAFRQAAERAEERLLTVLRQEVNYEIHKALAKAR